MTQVNQERLHELFRLVLDLPAVERDAFLSQECAGDAVLEGRLRRLVVAAEYQSASTPASASAGWAAGAPREVALLEGPGTWIGPYRLVQQVGEGGFGVVFLAEQERPVARKVALKIIKLGMDTRQVVARFEQERQALALMDHPHIARVIDAGSTATGRPYFVMDFVEGEPISQYCDARKLSIEERLRLFIQVCNAVQHAHTKGLIHRDLKPSNILVSTRAEGPHAHVIDFGIAKATSAGSAGGTLLTEMQEVVGTLQYMSPEQAEGSADLDTRTDVYSLGVLLYELLTASTPLDATTLRGAMLREMIRMIREVEPPKPSTRVGSAKTEIRSIAEHRHTEPVKLGRLLRGELDWIAMKALEKERERRYESASDLAADLRRYLAGEAVVAAPPSALYGLRKFLRRNKGPTAAALAVALALVLGSIGFAWQAHIASAERDDAVLARQAEERERESARRKGEAEAAQRALAERNEQKADAINQFLLEVLGANRLREFGREATILQALDRAAENLDGGFEIRPEVEAGVRLCLGRSYTTLGALDQAEPHLEIALELHRQHSGEASADFARALHGLGSLYTERNQHEAAARMFQQGFDIALATVGYQTDLAQSLEMSLANSLAALGRAPEAEALLRKQVELRTRDRGRDAADTLIAINSLAVLLHSNQQLEEAESLYREAIERGELVHGPRHVDTVTPRMNLASLLRERGDLREAEALMRECCEQIREVFGSAHPRTATAARNLGLLLADQGRFGEAKPLWEEVLAVRTRSDGVSSAAVAESKENLARTLWRLGDLAPAEQHLRDAIAIREEVEGAAGRGALDARLDLAKVLSETVRVEETAALFGELIEDIEAAFGASDHLNVVANCSYGVFLMNRDRFAEAEPFLRKSLELGLVLDGPDHMNTIITLHNLAGVARELGQLAEAEKLGAEALASFERILGPRHGNLALAHKSYASTLEKLGRNADAQRELERAIEIAGAAFGEKSPTTAMARLALARLRHEAGDASATEAPLRADLELLRSRRGATHRDALLIQLELGRCLALLRRFPESEAELTNGRAALEQIPSSKPGDLSRAARYLAELYDAWNLAEPDAERAAKAASWRARVEASSPPRQK